METQKRNFGRAYLIMTVVGVGLYLAVRWLGSQIQLQIADAGAAATVNRFTSDLSLAQLMIALAVITVASRGLGALCRRYLGQPPVIGEILAGVLLGPSLLGALLPAAAHALFPSTVVPALSVVSRVGVVLFMFVIGLEVDSAMLKRSARTTFIVSHASIVVPFVLGSILALILYPRYCSGGVSFTSFSLFCGISMSITAFPVLARFLRERGVQATPFGTTVLACAAVDDVTAWGLLALVIAIVTTKMDELAVKLPLLIGYFGVMLFLVRPMLLKMSRKIDDSDKEVSSAMLTMAFVGLLLSAAATEFIGIHALFGAFLFGTFLPVEGRLAKALLSSVENLISIVFLPAFFAFNGLRTQLSLVGGEDGLFCLLIIAVATLGKFGGSYFAGRYAGMPRRESCVLGVLMNTRGLIELIVLNIGLDMGIISPRLFAMLVVMALVTTFITSPLFTWLSKGMSFDFDLEREERLSATGDKELAE